MNFQQTKVEVRNSDVAIASPHKIISFYQLGLIRRDAQKARYLDEDKDDNNSQR